LIQCLLIVTQVKITVGNPLIDLSLLLFIILRLSILIFCRISGVLKRTKIGKTVVKIPIINYPLLHLNIYLVHINFKLKLFILIPSNGYKYLLRYFLQLSLITYLKEGSG